MKKLFWLLWFSGFISYAQTDFTRIYHPIINEAELAIVDTSYYEALEFYKEAFANVEKPFAKDYYNAAICATLIDKMPLAFDFLEKIVEKGYQVKNFRKDNFFKTVADTCKQWAAFEKRALLIKPHIDTELSDSLRKIYQHMHLPPFARITPQLRDYYKTHNKDTKWVPVDSLIFMKEMPKLLLAQVDSLRKVNDTKRAIATEEAFMKTYRILESVGFPDENLIGLNQETPKEFLVMGSYIHSKSFLLENTFIPSILSSALSTQKGPDIDIMPLIKQAIRDGRAHPAIISWLMNYSPDEPYTMGRVLVFQVRLENNTPCPNNKQTENPEQFFWRKEKPSILTEHEINEKRQSIGLEKLEDTYKKAFFKARPTPFLIYTGIYQAELSYVANCEMMEKMIAGAVLIR